MLTEKEITILASTLNYSGPKRESGPPGRSKLNNQKHNKSKKAKKNAKQSRKRNRI